MDEMSAALAGRTVAVFAGGLNHIGPKSNQNLFEQIESHSGALISELCPGTVPEAKAVPAAQPSDRGIVIPLIVAQARARSGALNTAGWANELNRTCSPCRETSTMHNTGCNALSKTAEPPSSAHWRRSTNYAIARIARNMSTCRMTPNIRRNRQTNPTMPYSPPLKLAPKQRPRLRRRSARSNGQDASGENIPSRESCANWAPLELEGRISMRSGWIIAEQR